MSEADVEDLGPIDSREWPKQLDAHAISGGGAAADAASPDGAVRLFGYDVERDLAASYRFSDLVFLALTGELPDDARSRAFEIALCFAAPRSIAHAGIHAAALARMCGARPSGVLSAAGLVLGEEASALVASINETLAARAQTESSAAPPAPLAAALLAVDDAERTSVTTLAKLLEGVLEVSILHADPSRDVALLGVFRACGITEAFRLASLIAFARLPSALAEANAIAGGGFAGYPIDTPHFEYVAPAVRS
jgi:hypothetical protein